MEIRLIKKESWTLRIKDDCKPFDPMEWLQLHQDEDKVANIGIRMVTSVSEDFSYVSSMRMNSLLIRL